jgi:RNA polymerase sigma factor (sigma-70 family)
VVRPGVRRYIVASQAGAANEIMGRREKTDAPGPGAPSKEGGGAAPGRHRGVKDMPTSQLTRVVHQLRRAALRTDGCGQTDGQLLGAFIERQDSAAFEALVRRHGPMVLGVCRRVLGHAQDAEDAFQATFLVLVRKATSIVPREALSGWLWGVAHRTALGAKAKAGRRKAREKQVRDMPHPQTAPSPDWQELAPILDEELGRLPEKYRLAVVLCDLEGRPRREAARQLKWPEGTLSSRLAAARKMLARRLRSRGVTLGAGALIAALPAQATAGVPAPLLASTVKIGTLAAAGHAAGAVPANVAALAEGVTKSMFVARLKLVIALAASVGALGVGGGFAARQPDALAQRASAAQDERPRAALGSVEGPISLAGHPSGAVFAAFTKSDQAVITVDGLGTVRVCDPLSGRERQSFKAIPCSQAAVAPDGKTLVVGGWKQVALYDLGNGRELWSGSWSTGRCWGVGFTPDGKRLVSGSDDGAIRMWESGSGAKATETYLVEAASRREVVGLAISPDGRTIAYGGPWVDAPDPKDPMKRVNAITVRLRELDTGNEAELCREVIGPQRMFSPGVTAIAFNRDGSQLAAAVCDGPRDAGITHSTIHLWDVKSGRELQRLGASQEGLASLAYSPDGRTLASAQYSGAVRLWEVGSAKVRRTFEAGKSNFGGALTFSADGKRLLSGVGVPRVWIIASPHAATRGEERAAGAEGLKKLWADLASPDAEVAYRAACDLIAAPADAVPLLAERVRAAASADAPRVEKLIEGLDSGQFTARERASKELESLGEMAIPAVRKALAGRPSAEARRRLDALLARDGGVVHSTEAIRTVRAVEVLEQVGTSNAWKALAELGKDLPDAWAGHQAKLALERRPKRP